MTCFELFSLMYYALDAQFDLSPNKELGNYLSAANPFLFQDVGSADPSIYEEFKANFSQEDTKSTYGYDYVKRYILSFLAPEIDKAFDNVTRDEWVQTAIRYEMSEHKTG